MYMPAARWRITKTERELLFDHFMPFHKIKFPKLIHFKIYMYFDFRNSCMYTIFAIRIPVHSRKKDNLPARALFDSGSYKSNSIFFESLLIHQIWRVLQNYTDKHQKSIFSTRQWNWTWFNVKDCLLAKLQGTSW